MVWEKRSIMIRSDRPGGVRHTRSRCIADGHIHVRGCSRVCSGLLMMDFKMVQLKVKLRRKDKRDVLKGLCS